MDEDCGLLLESGSKEAVDLLKLQIAICEAEGVEILCCPETVLGGLADYSDHPSEIAFNVESGQLEAFLSPLSSNTVSLIVGFTESTNTGELYNSAAVLQKGNIIGLYRKVYPAVNHSIYTAGDQLPTFTIGSLKFGIVICNDTNYLEPARVIANCSFNRPFDDQTQIRLEAEAKLHIQERIQQGTLELAWSYILDYENLANPFEERRSIIQNWKAQAIIDVEASREILTKPNLLEEMGLHSKDALHLSCSVSARCDYFVTTDDIILRKMVGFEEVKVVGPPSLIRSMEP